MLKYSFTSALLLLVATGLFASYSTDWIRPADSYLKSGTMIARDKSNSVIVTGYIQAQNIYTRKYDKFGNLKWEKTSSSGIHSNYEKPMWVNCDVNKNVYVVGYRYSISSSWEYPNAVVVLKYSPGGTLLWKRNISLSYIVGSSTGLRFNLRSELDSNGNLFIGTAGTTPSGFVLIKLNPTGTVLVNSTINMGTIHGFHSMRLRGNKVIITGRTASLSAVPVIAWDTSGTHLWTTSKSGQSGADVEIDGSGNIYLLSSYPNQVSPNSGQDIVIYKLNASGAQLWKKKYDFGGYDYPTRFTLVSNKISVIGFGSYGTYFDWLTFQLTASGAMLWNTKYNGTLVNDEQPYFISAKANGEVFVTGKGGPVFTQSNGSSYLRMVTLKYGNTGAVQWIDSLNVYSGWGLACTLGSDSSLFVLSGTNMTAFHFLDHTGTGACGIPSGLNTTSIQDTSAVFSWTPVPGAYLYHLRYKTTAAATWTIVSTNLSSINLKTFTAGTSYNYSVEAICSSGPSGYSSILTFTTTGTGYCATGGQSTAQEYLSLVWIGGIQNSTLSNNGYGDFTNLSTNLIQGSTVYGYLSAFLTFGLTENYSIWIDYNHDNDFSDAGEQAVNISSNFLGYIAVNFTVPMNALPGTTRMRVMMVYGSTPVPCGLYPRGETEDYSVLIVTPVMNPGNLKITDQKENDVWSVFPNPFHDKISVDLKQISVPVTFFIYDVTGTKHKTFQLSEAENELDLSSLNNGIYFIQMIKDGQKSRTIKIVKE